MTVNVGWLLDAYIEGDSAVLWVKCESGKTLRLTDPYSPDFYLEPQEKADLNCLQEVISTHPAVRYVSVEERYTSISSQQKTRVLRIHVDHTKNYKKVVSALEVLKEVKALYNVDIIHIQKYLFTKKLAPTSKIQFQYDENLKLTQFKIVDDGEELYPPPFTTLFFSIDVTGQTLMPNPSKDPVCKIKILHDKNLVQHVLCGDEKRIFLEFEKTVKQIDPDFIFPQEDYGLKYILERSRALSYNINLGREPKQDSVPPKFNPYTVRGRVVIDGCSFSSEGELGLCGIVEFSRFTFAPPRLAAEWSAGKKIDSRQCFEALKKDILIPRSHGFFKFITTVKDIVARDKGGLILSPKVGLHENVGELDFESMFPNLIIHFNLSYETVTPTGVKEESRRGFLVEMTKQALDRRLYFKHLRKKFPVGSVERLYCEQRQTALKTVLVCIYGYSGCFANRFNNVTLYEEINRLSRERLVKTINLAREREFEVIYADTDSIFVKKNGARREDYEALCAFISKDTGLPIALDHHYKFLMLLPQECDFEIEATRRYFGKLVDGSIFYRGIELRRHDYPPFLKDFQEKLIQILFEAEDAETVRNGGFKTALNYVVEVYEKMLDGEIDIKDLVISKVLRKGVKEYKSMFPHVSAALLLNEKGCETKPGDIIDFIYVNAEHPNPLRRVMPMQMLNGDHRYYDKVKYSELLLDVAETILGWNGFNRSQFGVPKKPRNFLEEFRGERQKEVRLELKSLEEE